MSFDMMHQPGPCLVCGDTNYSLSCGGPTICPNCDCGNFDAATVLKQAKVIAELRAQLATVAQAKPELPPVEEIARAMWEGDHEGSWDDIHANPKMTREIYMGNAEDAIAVVRQWSSVPLQEGKTP